MERNLSQELIYKTTTFLSGPTTKGENGVQFFTRIFKAHGKLNVAIWEHGFPHSIHTNEGMMIRNFMRDSGLCEDWTDHDYDNNWEKLVLTSLNLL